jgi:hypothetical protein
MLEDGRSWFEFGSVQMPVKKKQKFLKFATISFNSYHKF